MLLCHADEERTGQILDTMLAYHAVRLHSERRHPLRNSLGPRRTLSGSAAQRSPHFARRAARSALSTALSTSSPPRGTSSARSVSAVMVVCRTAPGSPASRPAAGRARRSTPVPARSCPLPCVPYHCIVFSNRKNITNSFAPLTPRLCAIRVVYPGEFFDSSGFLLCERLENKGE